MSGKKSRLFEAVKIGNLNLKNRIVMAPMTRNFSPGGIPGDDVADYYQRRAEAGVALIVTEGTTVNHKAANGYPNVPVFYGEEALSGWKNVVEKVHRAGGLIAPQLWHVGDIRKPGMEPDPAVPGYGPMEIVKDGVIETVGMTKGDIDEVTKAFASAAASAKDLGFDAVEIHGAHEYLIDQFLWEGSNQRSDEYGGSLENRLRFAIEIVEAVRAAVGPGFPIIFRFSQWKQQDYKAKLAKDAGELERLLMPLCKAGVDIFHASTRRFWEPEFEGSELNLAGWARKITGRPAITVGSVGLDSTFTSSFGGGVANPTNLDALNERLDRGEFDLVAVGRALLADAEWALKIKEGREGEIKAVDLKEALHKLS